ncbi:MAG: roadblock/LC7 domain-containing protein [Candidatus Heimdallarchaeum endolithica]|uniref:Roadblock/LC7 domain-containing protein n=1 Tax=Candidatus Heimdallarchaeum endolithica TaxID=2876572 RepID=A0A9Y1BQ11_9ARCH|nr:MAG: roadblock/LC7 domain-containing protein [Candidatus Heimdallarchaeum endolithica]
MISQKQFEETLKKLESHPSVRGVIITSNDGLPISSTKNLSVEMRENVSALVASLVGRAKAVVSELEEGDLNFFTLDTTKGEILVAPEQDYVLIVLRNKQK